MKIQEIQKEQRERITNSSLGISGLFLNNKQIIIKYMKLQLELMFSEADHGMSQAH